MPPPAPPRSGAAPLPVSPAPFRQRPGRRGWLLRLVLLAAILGAVLTVIQTALPASVLPPDSAGTTVLGVPAVAYHQVLLPLLALVALAGALILDKQTLGGLFLLLGGTILALPGGGTYLIPAAILGAAWAAWRHDAARTALGLVLLIPGVVAGYYGLAAAISLAGHGVMPGLPPSLDPPARWAQLAWPLGLLAAGWIGAWLLLEPVRDGSRSLKAKG